MCIRDSSYVDPNGKVINVKYSAGKDGFQVEGDHLPQAPQPVAPAAADVVVPQGTPVQQAQPQPLPLFTPQQPVYTPQAVAPQQPQTAQYNPLSVTIPSAQQFDQLPPHLQYVALLKQYKPQLQYNPQPQQLLYSGQPQNVPIAAKSSYQ